MFEVYILKYSILTFVDDFLRRKCLFKGRSRSFKLKGENYVFICIEANGYFLLFKGVHEFRSNLFRSNLFTWLYSNAVLHSRISLIQSNVTQK